MQANTFQVVLATDGFLSFVFYIYIDIQWGGPTQLGFNAGDGMNSFTLPDTFNTSADVLNLESTSNVGIPGCYIFRVDTQQILRPGGMSQIESNVQNKLLNVMHTILQRFLQH